jgi:hypothetical protein
MYSFYQLVKGKTFYPNRYLKAKSHIDPSHLQLNFEHFTSSVLDHQLDMERKVFQGQAQSKIIDLMVGKARDLGMTFRGMTGITQIMGKFIQLCTPWKQDNISSEMQKQMRSVCVGCFDNNWDQKLEVELMNTYKMSYNAPTSARNKGCLSILIWYKQSTSKLRETKRKGATWGTKSG